MPGGRIGNATPRDITPAAEPAARRKADPPTAVRNQAQQRVSRPADHSPVTCAGTLPGQRGRPVTARNSVRDRPAARRRGGHRRSPADRAPRDRVRLPRPCPVAGRRRSAEPGTGCPIPESSGTERVPQLRERRGVRSIGLHASLDGCPASIDCRKSRACCWDGSRTHGGEHFGASWRSRTTLRGNFRHDQHDESSP